MSEKKGSTWDPQITQLQVLSDLLFVLLSLRETKHPDPRVWEAFGRLDATRRQLQRELGQEPTELVDPYGRASYDK